jgi:hypothetical protein
MQYYHSIRSSQVLWVWVCHRSMTLEMFYFTVELCIGVMYQRCDRSRTSNELACLPL